LPGTLFQKDTAIESQLIRCGVAIGANVSEAQQTESRSDFIHKMKIAAKKRANRCIGYLFVKGRISQDFSTN
jgi:hypothetical protein